MDGSEEVEGGWCASFFGGVVVVVSRLVLLLLSMLLMSEIRMCFWLERSGCLVVGGEGSALSMSVTIRTTSSMVVM
jgi:hypothetical protein